MRHWLRDASAAAGRAADEPWLWLPGALAWLVTIGWLPLIAALWRPSASGLTYFGSGFFSSGAWPWNAAAVAVLAVALVGAAFCLAAAAEASLIDLVAGRRSDLAGVARVLAIALVTATPALIGVLLTAIAVVIVAPVEFTRPSAEPGPLVRTALRLAPLIIASGLAAVAGAALHAAAARHALDRRDGVLPSLVAGARDLRRAGAGALLQAVAMAAVRIGSLAIATILLAVLWAPIGDRLRGTIDAATLLLLVGFVAIWLCLVLGGGAVHAWGSVTWSRILPDRGSTGRISKPTEAPTHT